MRLALLLLGAAACWAQDIAQGSGGFTSIYQNHERTISLSHRDYVVVYKVCMGGSDCSTNFVPATFPAGQMHYRATISVFEQRGLERIRIYRDWEGLWTREGCFEDDPKTLVESALESATKAPRK